MLLVNNVGSLKVWGLRPHTTTDDVSGFLKDNEAIPPRTETVFPVGITGRSGINTCKNLAPK
jgi:hypothetical protein